MSPVYDPEAVRPMQIELENVGIRSLSTADEVDEVIGGTDGIVMIVINSVCGCAAGGCRPGVTAALQNDVIPDALVTVFAGVDMEAVQRVREYMGGLPPSSPNVILFKEGAPIFWLQRSDIETMTPVEIVNALVDAFNRYCTAKGPSVPREDYERNTPVRKCSSQIPLFPGN